MLLVFKSFSDVDDGTAYIYCFDFNRPWFDETNDNFHLGLGESRWLKSIGYCNWRSTTDLSLFHKNFSRNPHYECKMKAFKFILIIFIHFEFVSARHFQRNDNFTTKETSVQVISTPARKISTTTPSTTAPRPIPRPIGKLTQTFLAKIVWPCQDD